MPTWPAPRGALDRTALLLAGVGLVVGTGLALAVAVDASGPPVRAQAPLPVLPPLAGPTPMGLSAEPGEAARRPLFTPDRRPPLKATTPVASDGPDLLVTGVVTGPSGGAATGVDRKSQKPFSVRLGDDLQGWTVDAIGRSYLRLRRGAAVRDYPLAVPPPPTMGDPLVSSPPPAGPSSRGAAPVGAPPAAAPPSGMPPSGQPDPRQMDAQPSHPPSRPPPDQPPRRQP
ncbi:hypothetical protein [Nitrospirillum sp. BR 11828]|uniref:hypothetical protein n=1 Tax=Nitrospirillum sp. BR 11828 TaxID=3104325 RepID=UPI002ACAD246|nr:hypothetical protein [Nitrospirillum sp. BR 11828]MDZ5649535.1 hypothetical protein [Nitrospirillum sp. BR 11828]